MIFFIVCTADNQLKAMHWRLTMQISEHVADRDYATLQSVCDLVHLLGARNGYRLLDEQSCVGEDGDRSHFSVVSLLTRSSKSRRETINDETEDQ